MEDDYALFMTYNNNRYSRSPSGQSCNPTTCRNQRLCILSNTNHDEYRHCINSYSAPATPSTTRQPTTTTPQVAGAASVTLSLAGLIVTALYIVFLP